MYCKKLNIQSIPSELKIGILHFVNDQLKNNVPFMFSYDHHNELERLEYSNKYGISATVNSYGMPETFQSQLQEFYSNCVELENSIFYIQVVIGGNYVAPHIDPSDKRTHGKLYILDAGGDNVSTEYWKLKEQFKNTSIPEATALCYEKLEKIETHTLLENNWYEFTFNQIHSVQNQERARIAIVALKTTY